MQSISNSFLEVASDFECICISGLNFNEGLGWFMLEKEGMTQRKL